ncbi:similar to Saccharomyces cerevisiae YBR271W EFM2 Putative S-adenosylmethionine-dependent methyltransferase of the seven beta-strand family [Maudiozyma saulgeensis]|uniref:Similar to Saccharomyces cerevisiae YBR271W EFM2 Putative S-adenosylmethionine-dependent methyltransferase of the seven beta-strand family n=1 Tax=Maudiozyma saulgeensis TaxID=1789683 RepID=A0A1X7R184_9SACH|nr:similar to Saccharomyces cerevisiae YBR271W EFM2 Putative S-adenosylmethionine-dependent methyltransferase of the seven beta-strand family [Kazachstania saulgeensis]
MFDPLDLYDADKNNSSVALDFEPSFELDQQLSTGVDEKLEDSKLLENDEDDEDSLLGPIYVLDLPYVAYASPEVILATLHLLRPETQVNFQSTEAVTTEAICKSKDLDKKLQNNIVEWYLNSIQNKKLNTIEKICNKIPSLVNASETERSALLNYYTSILKRYENSSNTSPLKFDILKEVSLRIAECCGRSAIPSMSRDFKFDNMNTMVSLFEPSLTNDNLGWKTWGASLILSKILIENFNSTTNFKPKKSNEPLNVLELGAGTGLVGISWACKWKEEYNLVNSNIQMFVTDLPEILENLKKNVTHNNVGDFVTTDVLDWTNPKPFVEKYNVKENSFDIILVADPIYSPNHPEWVVNMLSKFLKTDGKCFLEIPIRSKYAKEREVLIQLLQENNFEVLNERYDQGVDDWGSVKYLYREIVLRN